jgi:cyclic pyranopterin phosphate synthase
MKDAFGRTIDYLRVSITDRCNYRCGYCMPKDVPDVGHAAVLRYEELLEICRAAVTCGIVKFKVTGGEPFVRKGAAAFIAALKGLTGVQSVTVTTNGYFLEDNLPALTEAGVQGINISLDTMERDAYQHITGVDGLHRVMQGVAAAVDSGIPVKLNVVLLNQPIEQLAAIALLAQKAPVDVRFIEVMPIGYGKGQAGPSQEAVLTQLQSYLPDLQLVQEQRGNGPAVYYKSGSLEGRIGFIAANTHPFCKTCNRMRLTSTGLLKPCLCYEDGIDLKRSLRSGVAETELQQEIAKAIAMKPKGHCFSEPANITEHKGMNQIGG